MHLISLKKKAIELRKQGYSYSYISSKLGVAKSTLSLWLKDISFIPNEATLNFISQGQKQVVEIKRADKAFSISTAIAYAEEKIGDISEKEFFLLGIGIYIGEGSKSHNFVRVVNSDPRIIRFMVKWFKKCFGLKGENFKVRIHTYPDTNEKETLSYWKKELDLPSDAFYTCSVDRRTNKKRTKEKILPHGTAHLSVVGKNGGVLLHRKILASIDRVLR